MKSSYNCPFAALLLSALVLLCASCGPLYHYFSVDKRVESATRIDFGDNIPDIYMVYPVDAQGKAIKSDSLSYSSLSLSLASSLEELREMESGSVGVYSLPSDNFCGLAEGKDIAYLRKLVEHGGSPLQIFVSNLKFYNYQVSGFNGKSPVRVAVPFSLLLEIFDAERDTLLYRRNQMDTLIFTTQLDNYSESSLVSYLQSNQEFMASSYGKFLATRISDYWITKELLLLNYGHLENWDKGYRLATEQYDWDGAIKLFMPYTAMEENVKASHAAYNVASCLYAQGKLELAMEWVLYAQKRHNFADLAELKEKLERLERR